MANPYKKKTIDLTLTPGKARQLDDALTLIESHVGLAADLQRQLSPEKWEALLARSPVLRRFLAIAEGFR